MRQVSYSRRPDRWVRFEGVVPVLKQIQIQGKDCYVNVQQATTDGSGNVTVLIELFDEEPSGENDVQSVEPAHVIRVFGDAATLHDQFEVVMEVLRLARRE
jgi:hypothetical protein